MSQADEMRTIAAQALEIGLKPYDGAAFGVWNMMDFSKSLLGRSWADMVYFDSIGDCGRSQRACSALLAIRCAAEVEAWIEKPTLSGERRIYDLLAMTRAKAAEVRMLVE
jgi:hypothetical protein